MASNVSLASAYDLPCGLKLQNRVSKAALAENMADSGKPGSELQKLWSLWSTGQWGIVLTGNVAVDSTQLGSPYDVSLPKKPEDRKAALASWTQWASGIQAHGVPALAQINHPGRQAPLGCRKGAAVAPSAIPLNIGDSFMARFIRWLAFGTPRELSRAEIKEVVDSFAATSKMCEDAGFKGIEIHAAHGYLIAQFMSAKSNTRTDEYGGSAVNRARILKEVVEAIRAVVSPGFAVGIKLNSADHQAQGDKAANEKAQDEVIEQIRSVVEGGATVDFLEISGGSYENPRMMGDEYATSSTMPTPTGDLPATSNTVKREAFFLDFAQTVRKSFPDLCLMVTGGFRTKAGMNAALESGACDLVGVGRPAIVNPQLPKEIISGSREKLDVIPVQTPWFMRMTGVKALSGGAVSLTYQSHMKKLIKSAML